MSSRRRTEYILANIAWVEHPRFVAIATVSFGSVVIDIAITVHQNERRHKVFALRDLGNIQSDPLKRDLHPLDSDETRAAILNEIVARMLSRSAAPKSADELTKRRTAREFRF
jgi:hypothetical protein